MTRALRILAVLAALGVAASVTGQAPTTATPRKPTGPIIGGGSSTARAVAPAPPTAPATKSPAPASTAAAPPKSPPTTPGAPTRTAPAPTTAIAPTNAPPPTTTAAAPTKAPPAPTTPVKSAPTPPVATNTTRGFAGGAATAAAAAAAAAVAKAAPPPSTPAGKPAVTAAAPTGKPAALATAPTAAAAPAGAPAPGGGPNVAGTANPGGASITIEREVFSYERGSRRDPFTSLLSSEDLRPAFADLRLVGVVLDQRGRNSIAVLRDLSTKEQYRLRTGATIGRLRVIQIQQRSVTFVIEEFGVTRQQVLSIRDSTRARTP